MAGIDPDGVRSVNAATHGHASACCTYDDCIANSFRTASTIPIDDSHCKLDRCGACFDGRANCYYPAGYVHAGSTYGDQPSTGYRYTDPFPRTGGSHGSLA